MDARSSVYFGTGPKGPPRNKPICRKSWRNLDRVIFRRSFSDATLKRTTKHYRFEAAHHLPKVPESHKCRRLHGHSYRLSVTIGHASEESDRVEQEKRLDGALLPIVEKVDHTYLNEVLGLGNPTAENLAVWIWQSLSTQVALLEVRVDETCESACLYRGE